MKQKKILNLLESYSSNDDHQIRFRQRMISFITGNQDCFESHHPPTRGDEDETEVGHITGSAWLLSPDKKAVLLTHHKKLNKWLQLGGHSDGESDVILTSLREAKEESGINEIHPLSEDIFDIDIHNFPKKKNVEAHLHYDIRFCLKAESYDFSVSEESHNLKWIPLHEITQDLFEESVFRMAQKTKNFLGPLDNEHNG